MVTLQGYSIFFAIFVLLNGSVWVRWTRIQGAKRRDAGQHFLKIDKCNKCRAIIAHQTWNYFAYEKLEQFTRQAEGGATASWIMNFKLATGNQSDKKKRVEITITISRVLRQSIVNSNTPVRILRQVRHKPFRRRRCGKSTSVYCVYELKYVRRGSRQIIRLKILTGIFRLVGSDDFQDHRWLERCDFQ